MPPQDVRRGTAYPGEAPDIQRLLESANKVCVRRESTVLRPVPRTKLAQSVAQKDRGRINLTENIVGNGKTGRREKI